MRKFRVALGVVVAAVVSVALVHVSPASALPGDYVIEKDSVNDTADCADLGGAASSTTWTTAVKINNESWSFDGLWTITLNLGTDAEDPLDDEVFSVTISGTGGPNDENAIESEPLTFAFNGSTHEVFGVVVKHGNTKYWFDTLSLAAGSWTTPLDEGRAISHIVFCLGKLIPVGSDEVPETGCMFSHGYFKNAGSSFVTDATHLSWTSLKGGGVNAVLRHLVAFLYSGAAAEAAELEAPAGPIYDDLLERATANPIEDPSGLAAEMGAYIEEHHC